MTGKVLGIYVSPRAAHPVEQVAQADLEVGKGIVGDRYYLGMGTFSKKLAGLPDVEVTLIEAEEIDRFNAATGLDLDYGALRRNIVTRGIGLNALVGSTFKVGAVTLEGIRLCEPCAHIAKLVAPGILTGMVHKAGLRARIVSGGQVAEGDSITAGY